MSFRKDNDAYDVWLARHCDVVKKDVRHKHTKSRFIFLRATYSLGEENRGVVPGGDGCAKGPSAHRGRFRKN